MNYYYYYYYIYINICVYFGGRDFLQIVAIPKGHTRDRCALLLV